MAARKHIAPHRRRWLLVGSLVITSLADFDVFAGLLVGDPRIFHHQASHSLAVALLFGLLMGGLANLWKLNGIGWGIWGGGLYLSHIVLDLLVNDPTPPFGIQLLWPISDAYFISPITPFGGFHYYDPAKGMARTILGFDNFMLILQEIVFIAPFAALAWFFGNYRKA